MKKALSRPHFWSLTITGTVAFFAFWYLARALHFSPPQFLPMPHEVLLKLIELMDKPLAGATLPEHMAASLKRFGMGFGLAALVGIPLGFLITTGPPHSTQKPLIMVCLTVSEEFIRGLLKA